jgi:hypothetical protein
LTIVDCGPSRFAIWSRIKAASSEEVCKILMDNSPTFYSDQLRKLCDDWGVRTDFRCVDKPSGNGIVERNHRTIKRMARRSGISIAEMVYWYNFAQKDGIEETSAPSSGIYVNQWRCPGMMEECQDDIKNESMWPVGTMVFVKPAESRSTTKWVHGEVTGGGHTAASIEVDGLPRHISDVRLDLSADPYSNHNDTHSPTRTWTNW